MFFFIIRIAFSPPYFDASLVNNNWFPQFLAVLCRKHEREWKAVDINDVIGAIEMRKALKASIQLTWTNIRNATDNINQRTGLEMWWQFHIISSK